VCEEGFFYCGINFMESGQALVYMLVFYSFTKGGEFVILQYNFFFFFFGVTLFFDYVNAHNRSFEAELNVFFFKTLYGCL
jgi:hypothetical protein